MEKLNIAVIGIGGVGGYFGGKMARAFPPHPKSPFHIFFLARGAHLEAIRAKGLVLKSPEFGEAVCSATLATDRIGDLPPIDIFIISVKGYDLTEVAGSIKNYIKSETVILPLLNGADIPERLRKEIKTGIILPACVYMSAYIENPGIVVHTGNLGKVIFGKDPDHRDFKPDRVLPLFEKSSIDCQWREDARPAIWEKYVFIASFSLVSARYDKTFGEILDEPSLREEVRGVMNEINSIALRKKIPLPDGIIELSLKKGTLFPRDAQTSLQRDVNLGKGKNESDLLGGTIVSLGKEFGVPTPVTERIYLELLRK